LNGWINLSNETRDKFLELYNKGDLSQKEAINVGMNIETLKRRLREWRKYKENKLLENYAWIPDSPTHDYDKKFIHVGDDFVVISDIEIPDHDPAMLQAALLVGMEQNIKTLIIAGDFIATDNDPLNSWPQTYAEKSTTFEESLELASQILDKFSSWFDTIYIISGNHDERIARITGGEVWYGMLLKQASKKENKSIQYSRYPYMYVETKRGVIYICHQENYSQTPIKLAQAIYCTENGPYFDPRSNLSRSDKCHIIITHTHLVQSGFSPDGYRECYGIGTCRDPMKTKYIMVAANKHYKWNQGFLYVKRGYFHPLCRRTTDWEYILGSHAKDAEILDT